MSDITRQPTFIYGTKLYKTRPSTTNCFKTTIHSQRIAERSGQPATTLEFAVVKYKILQGIWFHLRVTFAQIWTPVISIWVWISAQSKLSSQSVSHFAILYTLFPDSKSLIFCCHHSGCLVTAISPLCNCPILISPVARIAKVIFTAFTSIWPVFKGFCNRWLIESNFRVWINAKLPLFRLKKFIHCVFGLRTATFGLKPWSGNHLWILFWRMRCHQCTLRKKE